MAAAVFSLSLLPGPLSASSMMVARLPASAPGCCGAEAEAASLAALATVSMKQSGIGREKTLSELRRSESAWIEDGASALVDRLSARMNWVTGLQTSLLWDRHREGRREESRGRYGRLGAANVQGSS